MMIVQNSAIRLLVFSVACAFASCTTTNENTNTTATTTASPPIVKELTVVSRPQTIEELMKQRGEQDQAKPNLHVVAPANNSTIKGSTVEVKLHLDGDLKGYVPH